jgi:hypothetical protein
MTATKIGNSTNNTADRIIIAGKVIEIQRSELPKGCSNIEIKKEWVQEKMDLIQSANFENCPPNYFGTNKGSPVKHKEDYFHMWLAAKTIEGSLDEHSKFRCKGLADTMKAKIEALEQVGKLESEICTKIKANQSAFQNNNLARVLDLTNELNMEDRDKLDHDKFNDGDAELGFLHAHFGGAKHM